MKILRIFTFSGKASRTEWWLVFIGWVILVNIMFYAEPSLIENEGDHNWLFESLFLLSLWPVFATQVRRWHDRGKSGLWCLISFVPFIGHLWIFIELGFFPTKVYDPWIKQKNTENQSSEPTLKTPGDPVDV